MSECKFNNLVINVTGEYNKDDYNKAINILDNLNSVTLQNFMVEKNFDNKRRIVMLNHDSIYNGIYLLDGYKIEDKLNLTKQEFNLFLVNFLSLLKALKNKNFDKFLTRDYNIMLAWVQYKESGDINALRAIVANDFFKYTGQSKEEYVALAKAIPALLEELGINNNELAMCYVPLCVEGKVPILECDKKYFNSINSNK